ncbi:hypothetical protein L7F22_004659 [Adiantum nelumboides]|nr:hypothetical protein [Adiantum nelumboides]
MASSSGLTFKLHPLVIVNVSDHYTRIKAQQSSPFRVFGCLLGLQTGRTVEIFTSFETRLSEDSPDCLDRDFLYQKQEQYRERTKLLQEICFLHKKKVCLGDL